MAVARATISFKDDVWKNIATTKNRSRVVNDALRYFFKAQAYLYDKEKEALLEALEDYYANPDDVYSFEEVFGKKF